MKINFLSLFPEMFSALTEHSIAKRASDAGLIEFESYNIRDYTLDKHRRVDDYPFGGGAGMVMAPQPIFDCFKAVKSDGRAINVYMSPKGKRLNHATVLSFLDYDSINILCGHYEGVDQRVIDELIDEEISIGDYVLTGGELPAMVLADAVMRHVPGVLGNEASAVNESFAENMLEYPHYTRPADFRGLTVPDVLLSGNHQKIEAWRNEQALKTTQDKRPDLLK
ncbi:MAG: tRNA (guanosine(37)-N1)-methyltransferase TrmD [Eubacteriales bacterium]